MAASRPGLWSSLLHHVGTAASPCGHCSCMEVLISAWLYMHALRALSYSTEGLQQACVGYQRLAEVQTCLQGACTMYNSSAVQQCTSCIHKLQPKFCKTSITFNLPSASRAQRFSVCCTYRPSIDWSMCPLPDTSTALPMSWGQQG